MFTIHAQDQDGGVHVFEFPVIPPTGTVFKCETHALIVKGFPMVEVMTVDQDEENFIYSAHSPDAQPQWLVQLYVVKETPPPLAEG